MITAVRVEAVGDSPAQLKEELDAITAHVARAAYFEGIAWRSYEIPDEVYPRRRPEDLSVAGAAFAFEFEGRKVLRFTPDDNLGVMPFAHDQDEYVVYDARQEAEASPLNLSRKSIVLERQLPRDWPPGASLLVDRPAKPTADDLAQFTTFAVLECVTDAAFRQVDGGYVVEYAAALEPPEEPLPPLMFTSPFPVTGTMSNARMAVGWPGAVFGETLGAASKAALEEVRARCAECGVTL